MVIISNPDQAESIGHYSPCVEHNGILYISGQLPTLSPDNSIPEGIEKQTDLVLQKIENILHNAGSEISKVLQVRVYISDISLWSKVNERYGLFFGSHKPARCIVPTRELHYGSLIEMEVTAYTND